MAKKANAHKADSDSKRQYLSQSDVPAYGLQQAVRIAQALADNYGKNPTKPLRVAQALEMQPTSGTFRMLCGASIAYGLTEGGYNAEAISLTPLGRRIVAPTKEGDDLAARKEALLRPRIVRDFLTRYNQSRLPGESIGRNVLEELGVPADRTQQVFNFVVESAKEASYLHEVKGQIYVDLDSETASSAPPSAAKGEDSTAGPGRPAVEGVDEDSARERAESLAPMWDPLESTCRHASLSIL